MGNTRDLVKKIRDTKGPFSCKDRQNKRQKWNGPNKTRRYSEEVARIQRRMIQKKILLTQITMMALDWKKSVFIPVPKKGNAKECSNHHTIALISHASKVMLKFLQTSFQQNVNHELPYVQAGFRKGRGTRDQFANIHWISKKASEFQKNIDFCFIDYGKAFDSVDLDKLWKILQEMGIPNYLTCLLRNLHAGQEATELDIK